jgi:uncharacterized protein (TIGR03437 family)
MRTGLLLCILLGTACGPAAVADAVNYTYDAAGRLIKVDYGNGYSINYTYDNAGNVLSRSVEASTLRTFTTVSDASYQAGATLAPSVIAAGFGQNLSTGTESATITPLPTKLAGTSVMVTPGSSSQPSALSGRATAAVAAPLFFVSAGQINYLIPPGTPAGTATVTIVNDTLGTVASGTLQISAVAPGLFSANSNGQGVAVAEAVRASADGTQTNVTVFQCGSTAGSCVPVPIDLGPPSDTVVLVLFGTGIRGFSNVKNVTATIGTANAKVLFAGAQGGFVGLDQVNVQIPRSLTGSGVVNFVLTVDGQPSNTVTISIK